MAYPIRTAAKISGISPDTIRIWERRYRAVVPLRTDGKRIFSREQVQRLILLRDTIAQGYSIGRIAALTDSQLEEILTQHVQMARHSVERFESRETENPLLNPIVRALEAFDSMNAQNELARLAWLMPTTELIHRVILPLLRLAGERWRLGAWTIAQEHLTSSLLRSLMGTQLGLSRYQPGGPRIISATPAGEMHELGALAAAILSSSCGLETIYLGPNLPAGDLVFAAEKSGAAAVILGLANPTPELWTLKELAWIADQMPAPVRLWLGGAITTLKGAQLHPRYALLQDFHAVEAQLIKLRQGAAT